jgi:hypothetical protein
MIQGQRILQSHENSATSCVADGGFLNDSAPDRLI